MAVQDRSTGRRAMLKNMLGGVAAAWAASEAVDVQAASPNDSAWGQGANNPFVVTSFGAKGDGRTDDTAAIQAALNAANAAGGGLVYLPAAPRGYQVTSSLTVYGSTTVRGDGWASLLQMAGPWAGTWGLFLPAAGSSRIIFEDFRIDGVKAAKSGATNSHGVYVKSASEIRIHRLHITDCGHAGILVDGGRDVVVSENFVTGGGDGTQAARANGISIDTGGQASSDVVIANNVCTAIPDSGIGVHDNSKNVTIIGNVIDGAGLYGGHGIDLAGCQQVSCTGNFVNCASTSDGIYVHQNLDSYSVLDVSITGNTIVGPGGPGCNGITVHGTASQTADRISLVGNTIRGMSAMGIYVAIECQSSVIGGNVCHGNAGNGIMIDSAGSTELRYVTVSGNTCTGNGAFGLCLHPGLSGCKLFGNTLGGNAAGPSNATDSVRWNNAWALNADGSAPQDHIVHTSQIYAALSYPNKFTIASGAPGANVNGQNPNTGDFYLRTDTPDVANQRLYVCTLGGNVPTWVGIA